MDQRMKKARFLAEHNFTHVMSEDTNEKARTVLVPGSEGKQYQVILRRFGHKITSECRLVVGANNMVDCKGNTFGGVCYHSMAAVMTSAFMFDFNPSITKVYKFAQKLKNLKKGGNVYMLSSHQSRKNHVYLVAKSLDLENEEEKTEEELLNELGYWQ